MRVSGFDEAQRLFTRGRIGELVRRSDCRPQALRGLGTAHRVLLAHGLALAGRSAEARAVASEHTGSSLDEAIRSHEHSGNIERAIWANLGLLRLLIETGSNTGVDAKLLHALRLTRQANLPQASAYFHACASIADGQNGRLEDAGRHCDAAESLLARSPNLALHGTLLLNRSCIHCLACDFTRALKDLRLAQVYVERSGLSRNAATLRNNRGYLELITGRFETARRSFQDLLRDRRVPRFVLLGALDGLARTHLAAGAIDACQVALDRIDTIPADTDLEAVYHVRWSALTRIRLLLHRGLAGEALRHAHLAETLAARTGDRLFGASANLLAARAHQALAQPTRAAQRLLHAVPDETWMSKAFLPDYFHHAAGLLQDHDAGAARRLRDRAIRVWAEQGANGLRREAERASSTWRDTSRPTGRDPDDAHAHAFSPLATALSVSACLEMADTPPLLARELVELLRGLGCTPEVGMLVAASARAVERARDELHGILPVGSHRGKHYAIKFRRPDTPAQVIGLASVLSIGRAAVARGTSLRPEDDGDRWSGGADGAADELSPLSTEMDTVVTTARRIAATDASVLLSGETGTGKELLARLIHRHSKHAEGPFVPFNCAAVAKELFDAQLFGHRKGAFTSASEDSPGVIRAAGGGTLLLDEIGEMAPDAQPKLLRFLESGEIHPVGATH